MYLYIPLNLVRQKMPRSLKKIQSKLRDRIYDFMRENRLTSLEIENNRTKMCISEYSDTRIGRHPDSDSVEGIVLAL